MSAPSPRIRVLPEQLANQIAAGEVVERPASVVKELVENSLDAGATRIDVEAERGGARLVRVRDDGHGIPRDQLALALSRHATSKLGALADLERIASLGFRGEALPSIASVSRLRLVSRVRDADQGWAIGGAGPEPAAHPPGTTVEVRDLFHNTPARRKFLRTERTEFGHLEAAVRRLALAAGGTGLSLSHNGRRVFALAPARDERARRRRLGRLLGEAFVSRAVEVDYAASGMRLRGVVALPDFSRGRTDVQHLFVNGRGVRDGVVAHAVRQAYGASLAEGRHPAWLLHLEVDPLEVDVNVHPTKHEVRFREARLVHDFVFRCLEQALAESLGEATRAGAAPALALARPGPRPAPAAAGAGEALAHYAARVDSGAGDAADAGVAHGAAHGVAHGAAHRVAHGVAPVADPAADRGADRRGRPRPAGTLWLHDGRFLVAVVGDGPVLVDVPRARETVCRARLTARDAPARPLLVPVEVPLPATAADAVEGHGESLARIGFDLRRSAPEAVTVRALPAPLAGVDASVLVADLATRLAAGEASGPRDLARLAARHAGTAAPATSAEEATALLAGIAALAPDAPRPWLALTCRLLSGLLAGAGSGRGGAGGDLE